jgi:hypothetical protein
MNKNFEKNVFSNNEERENSKIEKENDHEGKDFDCQEEVDSLKEEIEENKKIHLPKEEIEKDEELSGFVKENKGTWFRDPFGPEMEFDQDGNISTNAIYYIDKDCNFGKIMINFKRTTIDNQNLEEELNKLGFRKIKPEDSNSAIFKKLFIEGNKHQNEQDEKREDEREQERKDKFNY